jgi:hypothetical protein
MTGIGETTMAIAGEAPGRKPRLVLLGEFSAGKSTLSNLLLGQPMLPVQVTATRLPPVHVSLGEPSARAEMADGSWIEVDPADLSALRPGAVRAIHLTLRSDTLELCDLVDMPGISDPNMPADTWDAAVRPGDHVIWCTHATQAWRQSEAATWDRLRTASAGPHLLLITQFDKLRTPRDQARVLARVAKEVEGRFAGVYPVALLSALAAGEDFEAWRASGAHDFMEHLIDLLMHRARPEAAAAAALPVLGRAEPSASAEPAAEILRPDFDRAAALPPDFAAASLNARDAMADGGARVTPRRVQSRPGGSSRPRPARGEVGDAWPFGPEAI